MPISTIISIWPAHNAEIAKNIKQTQHFLPPFGWDTKSIIGSEKMMKEACIDVFCDLIYGSGWMDLNRPKEYVRDFNWALVDNLFSAVISF